MDSTTLNTIVGIVGTVVGIIGIIIGIIGGKSLNEAKKIDNSAKAKNGSTINQIKEQNNNYGISDETIKNIANNISKEELIKLVIHLIPINTDNDDCIANKLRDGTVTAGELDKLIDEVPTIFVGEKEPPGFPNFSDKNAIWLGV